MMLRFWFSLIVFSIQLLYAQDSLVFVIRVDDVQSRGTQTPRTLNDFQNAVEQRGGKITWAVIPHRLIESQNYDGVLLREIKASVARGHEAAVHGYNHICSLCNNSGHEMFCTTNNQHLTYGQQTALLDSSLKLFHDSLQMNPVTFVPPGHYDDSTTYQVLLDKGFQFISSNGPKKNFIYKNLFNLQRHADYTWQLTASGYQSNLHTALNDVRTAAINDGYFLLLFHDPFIRQGYSSGLVIQWTAELLDSVNQQFTGKVKYRTLAQAASSFRSAISGANDEKIFASAFSLEQNYPNPFNPSTSISYAIPHDCFVSVRMYDALCREVETLVNEPKTAGSYTVTFNAGALPSGVYFYTLRSEEFIATKKLIILK